MLRPRRGRTRAGTRRGVVRLSGAEGSRSGRKPRRTPSARSPPARATRQEAGFATLWSSWTRATRGRPRPRSTSGSCPQGTAGEPFPRESGCTPYHVRDPQRCEGGGRTSRPSRGNAQGRPRRPRRTCWALWAALLPPRVRDPSPCRRWVRGHRDDRRVPKRSSSRSRNSSSQRSPSDRAGSRRATPSPRIWSMEFTLERGWVFHRHW